MSPTRQAEGMLRIMICAARPNLRGKFRLSVGYAHKLFIVSPWRDGNPSIRFGLQALNHSDLNFIIEEAARALEQHYYGLTTATTSQLDADTRWVYEQNLLPCTD